MQSFRSFLPALLTITVVSDPSCEEIGADQIKLDESRVSRIYADMDEVIRLKIPRKDGYTFKEVKYYIAPLGKDFTEITNLYASGNNGPQQPKPFSATEDKGTLKQDYLTIDFGLVPAKEPKALLKIEVLYETGGNEKKVTETKSAVIRMDHYRNYWDIAAIPLLARPHHREDAVGSVWKTGFAASVEYRFRLKGDGGGSNFFNFVEPAVGVHGALLNQTDDQPIEFGLGGNISVLSGWVAAGYGYNFSAQTAYYFIGLNLLNLANEKKPVK